MAIGHKTLVNDVTQQVIAQQQLAESEARYRTLAGELDELVQVRT